MRLGALFGICIGIVTTTTFASPAPVTPTNVEPLVLQQGLNEIPDLSDEEYLGHILVTVRYNADTPGRSYLLYQVLESEKQTSSFFPSGRWDVVGIETRPGTVEDVIHDNRAAANALVTVQFARGRVMEKPENLLFIARREPEKDNRPTPVTVEIYKFTALELDALEANPTRTPNFYKRILTTKTSRLYCNTDMALNQEWGFPLPRDYLGSKKADGCWRLTGTFERHTSDAVADKAFDPNWGIIFAGDKARELFKPCSRTAPAPDKIAGTWTPDAAQIGELEKQLAPFLIDKLKRYQYAPSSYRVGDYYRQYGGFEAGGHRFIYVNGFHRNIFRPGIDGTNSFAFFGLHDWTDEAVLICDGGATFFGVVYDPETHAFTEFGFNGVA